MLRVSMSDERCAIAGEAWKWLRTATSLNTCIANSSDRKIVDTIAIGRSLSSGGGSDAITAIFLSL